MKLQEKIEIKEPVDKVFPFLIDVDKRRDYIPLLEEVIFLDPPPLQLGVRYIEVSTIAGRRLETTYQVIGFEVNKQISVQTVKSVFPIRVDLFLLPIENSTYLKLQMQLELNGIYRLASGLIRGIVQQQAKSILENIKRSIEEG